LNKQELNKRIGNLIQRPIGILVLGLPAGAASFVGALVVGADYGFAAAGAVTSGLVFGVLSFLAARMRRD
jgi:hypothetical protein